LIPFAAQRIGKQTRASVYDNVSQLPHKRVALVLGCAPRLGGGMPNWYFNNRMDAAAAVFRAGKADYLLLSGDNHTRGYDEPAAMKEALVEKGIPADRLVLDDAGFSTSDSVVRAHLVFGLQDLCIVSQKDHTMRAIYIAQHKGLTAVGFAAQDIAVMSGLRTRMRESLARVRTLLDVHVWGRNPHFIGPPIEIGRNGETIPEAPGG
jgi:SanA protein